MKTAKVLVSDKLSDSGLNVLRAAQGIECDYRPGLSEDELDDLVNLAVNGEIRDPQSSLGEHVNARWQELVGPADRSLVHWLRRLVFRSAWLDQRVKEGELDIVFREDTQSFGYLQRDRGAELIELAPEPSWRPAAYN